MKKIMVLLIICLLLVVPLTVQAAEANVKVSRKEAKPGQMVYLTVSLSGCEKANTLGISMEYDSDILKKVVDECKWEKKGALQDFDKTKDYGVWTAKKDTDLNGTICTLAFRVKANVPSADTEVSCKVVVKRDSEEIGTYTAKGQVAVIGKSVSEDTETDAPDTFPDSGGETTEQPETTVGTEKPNGSTSKPQTSENVASNHKTESNNPATNDDEDNSEAADTDSESNIAEHVHPDGTVHSFTEQDKAETKNNSDLYVGIGAVMIIIGLGFLLFHKIYKK